MNMGIHVEGSEEEQVGLLQQVKDGLLQQEQTSQHIAGRRQHPQCVQKFIAGMKTLANSTWESGAACMALSAFIFACSTLCVKLIHNRVPTFQIVAFRSSTSFIVCVIYIAYHRLGQLTMRTMRSLKKRITIVLRCRLRKSEVGPFLGQRKYMGLLLSRGLFGAAAMSCYYLSISNLPLADAVTLFFMNPAVTAVAAWVFLSEPLGLKGLAGVFMSLIGLVVLSQPPFIFDPHGEGWGRSRMLGTLFGVLSALCAAAAFISIRLIGKGEQPLVMSIYFHICAMTTATIPLVVGLPSKAVWPIAIDWLLLVGVSATSFWGQILIGRGFQLLNAAKASAINFTQVVYSYLFGIVFLHERISLWGALGSVLIASGVLLVNQRPKASGAGGAAAIAGAKGGGETEMQVVVVGCRGDVVGGGSNVLDTIMEEYEHEEAEVGADEDEAGAGTKPLLSWTPVASLPALAMLAPPLPVSTGFTFFSSEDATPAPTSNATTATAATSTTSAAVSSNLASTTTITPVYTALNNVTTTTTTTTIPSNNGTTTHATIAEVCLLPDFSASPTAAESEAAGAGSKADMGHTL